jgi:hypothetical protein
LGEWTVIFYSRSNPHHPKPLQTGRKRWYRDDDIIYFRRLLMDFFAGAAAFGAAGPEKGLNWRMMCGPVRGW